MSAASSAPDATPEPQAFFLPTPDPTDPHSQRFCLFHAARATRARGAVLHVHAWAEEMNKSRRMVAMQARALADAGYAVLLVDLQGCGDSSGDFGDASWSQWLADIDHAVTWLRQQTADAPLCLWGLRAGCLLAVQAAVEFDLACDFVFWQPPTQGKALLQQFMRLKAAAEMQNVDAKETMAQLRGELDAGRPIEVAGYRVSAALAQGLEQASLKTSLKAAPPLRRVLWLETATRADASLLPASQLAVEAWRAAGHTVASQVVTGPAFWQTQEIEDAADLVPATLLGLQAWSAA